MQDLQRLKDRLTEKRLQKSTQKRLDDAQKYDHFLQEPDILVVLHDYEVELLEKLLFDALEYWDEDVLTNAQKRIVLNLINLLQGLTREGNQ